MSEGRKSRGTFGAVGASMSQAAKKSSRVSIPDDEIEDGSKPFASRDPNPVAAGKIERTTPAKSPDVAAPLGDSSHSSDYRIVSARTIRTWKYKDRRAEELDRDPSYADLIRSARAHGIIEPIIVRETQPGDDALYEEIAGFKRVNVGKLLDIDVPIVIRNMTDREASLIQKDENEGRSPPSPWSKALHYLSLLDDGVYDSQTQLADAHEINKGTLSNLLRVVRKMPEDLVKSVDMFALSGPSLIHLISSIDNYSGEKEAIIDRLVEHADELNAKPEKAIATIDRAIASLSDNGSAAGPSKTVYQSAKGKTLTVQARSNAIQLTVHASAMALISADELTDLVTRHLADKGLATEKKK